MSDSFNKNVDLVILCDQSREVTLTCLNILTKTVPPSEALFLLPLRLQRLSFVLPTELDSCRRFKYQKHSRDGHRDDPPRALSILARICWLGRALPCSYSVTICGFSWILAANSFCDNSLACRPENNFFKNFLIIKRMSDPER